MNLMNLVFDPKKHSIFTPINKDKYRGDVFPVVRSSWEDKFYKWCDMNPHITSWVVEGLAIEYFDPVKKKNRRYYPDVLMAVKTNEAKDKIFLVEIKPYKEIVPPIVSPKKKEKTMLRESVTYRTNMAKWKAAELYCRKRNWEFKILSEKDLFKDGKA